MFQHSILKRIAFINIVIIQEDDRQERACLIFKQVIVIAQFKSMQEKSIFVEEGTMAI